MVETDEKGHADRNPDYEKRRQKELEKLGYHFIRINPHKIDFSDYEEFGRVSTHVAESVKKQTEEPTKFKSNYSIKWIVKKVLLDYKNEW